MAYILITSTYPPHKTMELAKLYTSGKQPKYPDFVKRVHRFVVMDNDVKGYALYEVPDDKIIDGGKAIAKRQAVYSTIEGYKYRAELLMTAEDALEVAGLG